MKCHAIKYGRKQRISFGSRQELGAKHYWRTMVRIRPQTGSSSPPSTFVLILWCPGGSQPYFAALQRLGRDEPDKPPEWICTVVLSDSAGREQSRHRLSWTSPVPDIDAAEVWRKQRSTDQWAQDSLNSNGVVVIPQKQMASYNIRSSSDGGVSFALELSFKYVRPAS